MENLNLSQNSWICKSNKLINATYKLSTGEQKLILAISSMVNPLDEDFREYIISIQDFARLLGVNLSTNKNFYSRVKRASSILLSKRVTIHEEDGDFQTLWLSGIKYYDREGKVAVSFHPRLKTYYLQLKEYTKYKLKNIISLKSEYSIKLYEVLKQYEKIGERLYSLDEFKNFIGIEKQYDRFYDLKKRVLLVAQKELEEKTDIKFEFKELKEGRSITGIKFKIHRNEKKVTEQLNQAEDEKAKQILDIMPGLTTSEVKKILDAANMNVDKVKEKYFVVSKIKNVKNIVGAILAALKEDWIEPKEKVDESKSTFNNFKQRNYDFNDLKRKLLGWDKEEDEKDNGYKQVEIKAQ